MPYKDRIITPIVKRYLKSFPVLGLTGPRQSGKSTLLQHILKNYQYVSFDDFRVRDYFDSDPVGFLDTYHERGIFDEAQ